jgi:hypothetical protein
MGTTSTRVWCEPGFLGRQSVWTGCWLASIRYRKRDHLKPVPDFSCRLWKQLNSAIGSECLNRKRPYRLCEDLCPVFPVHYPIFHGESPVPPRKIRYFPSLFVWVLQLFIENTFLFNVILSTQKWWWLAMIQFAWRIRHVLTTWVSKMRSSRSGSKPVVFCLCFLTFTPALFPISASWTALHHRSIWWERRLLMASQQTQSRLKRPRRANQMAVALSGWICGRMWKCLWWWCARQAGMHEVCVGFEAVHSVAETMTDAGNVFIRNNSTVDELSHQYRGASVQITSKSGTDRSCWNSNTFEFGNYRMSENMLASRHPSGIEQIA